jgi:hypothetical protein
MTLSNDLSYQPLTAYNGHHTNSNSDRLMEANAVRSGEKKDPSLHGGEEFSFDEVKDKENDGSVSFRLLVHRYV